MSNPDPSKVIFSSRYRYFLNKPKKTGDVSIAGTSVDAFSYKTANFSVPMDSQDDFTQIKINFSHAPNDWHIFPCLDVTLDTNFTLSVTGSRTTSGLDVIIYVVNQSAGSATNTATTVTVGIAPFEPPI